MVDRYAVVSGASSGIGEAVAKRLASRGLGLFLLARRADRLERLKESCLALGAPKIETASLDVRDRSACDALFTQLARQRQRIDVLVNSAGLAAGVEPMDRAAIEDWEAMVETNVLGLLYLTRLAIPALKESRGHIVNLGSVAGHWTYPGGGVYCATKAAVRALTEGLRLDLAGTGVRVTNIEPGMVETEFSVVRYHGDRSAADKVYEGMQPLTADDIAECIDWSLTRPPHVNIQEMMIFPVDQAGVGSVHRGRGSHSV